MRGRLALAALIVPVVIASVTACGGTSASTFHPSGAVPSASAGGPVVPARAATAPGGYRFPAGVAVDFAPATQTSVTDRAILASYHSYALALWAAASSAGQDSAYQSLAGGSALSFIRREVAYFSAGDRELRGTISYSNTTVSAVYFGTGTTVTSCVDASAFHVVDSRSGVVTGSVFPASYARYLEVVTEARRANGTWLVNATESYPASTSEGAECS